MRHIFQTMAWRTLSAKGGSSESSPYPRNTNSELMTTLFHISEKSLANSVHIGFILIQTRRCACVSVARLQHLHLLYPSSSGACALTTILRCTIWIKKGAMSLVVARAQLKSWPNSTQLILHSAFQDVEKSSHQLRIRISWIRR